MTLLWMAALLAADPPKPDSALAAKAAGILERYCVACHKGPGSSSGYPFDVRNAATLVAGDEAVVAAKKSKESALWTAMHKGKMPPPAQTQLPRPTPEESETIASWITSGAAAFPAPTPRPVVAPAAVLTAIRDDLRRIRDEQVRRRQRYFTLAHLNNDQRTPETHLRLVRAGLAKALNSMSWERELAAVRTVDSARTVLAVDLGKLGWTRDDHWRAVRSAYPYAVGYANLEDATLRDLDAEIIENLDRGEPLYAIRADWLIAVGTQPPLYHELLYDASIPALRQNRGRRMNERDLEAFLGVDAKANIQEGGDRCARAGFNSSGVSGQNRMVERHRTRFGAYWKSYDFKADNRRAILSQFPLGPADALPQFAKLSFQQDGGEIIYSLPNAMHGYLLVDSKGDRIDGGPIEVVSDSLKTSGTPVIVNGLSCMACHRNGMIDPPADEIRRAANVFGDPKQQLERLYPKTEDFAKLVRSDRDQFVRSLKDAVLPHLQHGTDKGVGVDQFAEPTSAAARRHLLEEVDLATAAAELGEPDDRRLRARLESDDVLGNLGLRVLLAEGGRIKRAYWESRQGGPTVMQLTAFTLGYTTPLFNAKGASR